MFALYSAEATPGAIYSRDRNCFDASKILAAPPMSVATLFTPEAIVAGAIPASY